MTTAIDLESALAENTTFLEGRTRLTDTTGYFTRLADYRDGGIFAETWEGTVHHFQRLVIDCLTSRKQPFTGPNRQYRKRTRHGGETSWGRSI